ncbi:hypothetical protein AB9M62_10945 [Bacillales bacterium AN1005]
MSFLKGLGQFAGEVTGKVLGGSVRVVGEIAGSSYIKEIGNGVEKATINTGKTVGQLVSGTYDLASGAIRKDQTAIDTGLSDLGDAVTHTAKGVVISAKYVYKGGKDVVVGLKDEDMDRAKIGAKNLIAAAAVTTLAIGLVDAIDGVDSMESAESVELIENPNTHDVTPHQVEGYTRADGTHVESYFRDGDGDTSIDQPDGGYVQHNPNYRASTS